MISLSDVSKRYRLGVIGTGTLTHDLQRWRNRVTGRVDPVEKNAENLTRTSAKQGDIWALRHVSLDIQQGEVLGIIGKNGAGKSTLLKLLSRITNPTTGTIRIRGTLSSLLEVGTGFHPELTGRENIFLNGSLLGMRKTEVRRKFDAIVDFSGVELFIDTPVKHYSSGMYVRLAFAVAAFLEPDILILDEILAVGDYEFQKRCTKRIDEIARQGCTILFVSHNLGTVASLCRQTILLEQGTVRESGPSKAIINIYLQQYLKLKQEKDYPPENRPGDEFAGLRRIFVHDQEGRDKAGFDVSETIGVTVVYEVRKPGAAVVPAINVFNDAGVNIFDTHCTDAGNPDDRQLSGLYRSTVWFPGHFFNDGGFFLGVGLVSHHPFFIHCHEQEVVSFAVTDLRLSDTTRGRYQGDFPGILRPLLQWNTIPPDDEKTIS